MQPPTRKSMPSADPQDDGVDVTLIRWMLEKTPTERLRIAHAQAKAAIELRNGQRILRRILESRR